MPVRPELRTLVPVALLLGLAALEPVSAVFGGIWTQVAAWSWVGFSVMVLTWTWAVIGGRLLKAVQYRHWMLLGAWLVGGLLTFSRIGSYEEIPINREATQQVVAGLENWHKPHLGYHESAFLGGNYPARQYLLVAAPSLLAGRDLGPLRFGYAFLFFTGWSLFLLALEHRWPAVDSADARGRSPAPVLAALMLFAFPPVIHWLLNYEQTILPLSFTLLTTGWFCLWLHDRRPGGLLPLGWCAGMLGTCYTPGLTAWALFIGLVALGFVATFRAAGKTRFAGFRSLGAAALYGLSMGATTLWTMRVLLPEKFTTRAAISNTPLSPAELLSRVMEGFSALGVHHAIPYMHPLIVALIAIPVIWLLTRRPTSSTAPAWLLGGWMIATLVAAVTLRGYCHRPPAFDLHRSMVILPPLLWLVGDFWRSAAGPWLERWTAPARTFALLLVAVAAAQFFNVRDPVGYAPYHPDTEVDLGMRIKDLAHTLPGGAESRFTTWVFPDLPTAGGVGELTSYFNPNVEVRREPPDLTALKQSGHPFIALLPDNDTWKAQIRLAQLPSTVLPGRPLLDHLPKQYLLLSVAPEGTPLREP